MVRNVEGLKRSAQVRSDDARERTTAAIGLMQSEEVEINFRTVAARAQVSTAWLYKTKTIRATIMKARTHRRPPPAKARGIVSDVLMKWLWQPCASESRRLRNVTTNLLSRSKLFMEGWWRRL